jgi:hypothetical protein
MSTQPPVPVAASAITAGAPAAAGIVAPTSTISHVAPSGPAAPAQPPREWSIQLSFSIGPITNKAGQSAVMVRFDQVPLIAQCRGYFASVVVSEVKLFLRVNRDTDAVIYTAVFPSKSRMPRTFAQLGQIPWLTPIVSHNHTQEGIWKDLQSAPGIEIDLNADAIRFGHPRVLLAASGFRTVLDNRDLASGIVYFNVRFSGWGPGPGAFSSRFNQMPPNSFFSLLNPPVLPEEDDEDDDALAADE